ncbi:DUF3841 domain-containing protein [Exiguobacterium algae]|uniref:DUF3841 domain-containing protein n=1 Tax=Exiguobacterium algae TaxID=2751250 RepID=UPI001BEBF70B|nr:DUF3841 domain-containing protein [Exiguobacterium algae]
MNLGIYYTYQREEAWKVALEKGELIATGEHALFTDPVYDNFKPAYDWMVEQYEERIGISMNGNYPIWCWDEFPDLGRGGHVGQGNKGVVLTVEIPDEEVLASEFSYWHHVLGDFPLYETLEEYDSDEMPPPEIIRQSWNRIFDKAWCEASVVDQPNVELVYQHVVHRIDLSQVRAVMPFVDRKEGWWHAVCGIGWRIGYKLGLIRSKPFQWNNQSNQSESFPLHMKGDVM